jgi:hypothetical protein
MALLRGIVITLAAIFALGTAGCKSSEECEKCRCDASATDVSNIFDTTADTGDAYLVLDYETDAGEGNMGEGCQKSSECEGAANACLIISSTKGSGICTQGCTPDDTSTPLINEDTCPKNWTCAGIEMTSGKKSYYCLQECTPSFTKNPCAASSKVACWPSSNRYARPKGAVCFYSACTSDKDCPVYSDKTCTDSSECTSVASDAFCDDGTCARPGNCTAGGICGKHTGVGKATAKVGDPCKSDLDCPETGICLEESSSSTGSIGVAYRNGYCVIRYCMWPSDLKEFACPAGTVCNNLFYGGYCFKGCQLNDTKGCRGHAADKGGDYECYDWTNWTTSGTKVATAPLCQNATTTTCDNTTCSSLGDSTNSTNMSCRDRYTGAKKSNAKDPKGICQDDTASGTFATSAPDAGPADAGAVDAKPADAKPADAGAGG